MWPLLPDALSRWRTAESKTRLQLCVVQVGAACVMFWFEEPAIFFPSGAVETGDGLDCLS